MDDPSKVLSVSLDRHLHLIGRGSHTFLNYLKELPSRSRHLIIRDGGHIFDGLSGIDTCIEPLMVRFLEDADPIHLDAACIDGMRAPSFVLASPVTHQRQ